MKTFLCFLLSLLVIQFSSAQSITLSPSTPGSPDKGTMVFDNVANLLKYWNGTIWIPMANAASGTGWSLSGANLYNTNTGNVGIATTTPAAAFNVAANKTVLFGIDSSGSGSKFIWYPSKSALRAGFSGYPDATRWNYANVGQYSIGLGFLSLAKGLGAVSIGNENNALKEGSVAIGTYNTASADFAVALGDQTQATGYNSTTMGYNTIASDDYATAMGFSTIAKARYSTAIGLYSRAYGHASVAMGASTLANSNYSIAMGVDTESNGIATVSMGNGTIASAPYSVATGSYNIDVSDALLMIGNGLNVNSRNNVMTVMYNGKIGIGTTDPSAPLHIANSASLTETNNRYFNYGTGDLVSTLTNGNYNLGLLVNSDIVTKNSFVSSQTVTTSDARVKNIIGLSDSQKDLALLQKIQITNYRYKDVANRGSQIFKKVIAQQVEEVYPEAVKKITSVIPDIYAVAEKVNYEASTKSLSITLAKGYGIKAGDKIQLVHPTHGEQLAVVESVSGNSFIVKNWQYATDKLFVYGREVNDFRTVDYEALSMLGISAIQQLVKEIKIDKITIEKLSKEIEALKKENNSLKTDVLNRLEALENRTVKEQIK